MPIELVSPGGFPIRDARQILRIGEQAFDRGGFKVGEIDVLVFGLTTAEFAALTEGDLVSVDYGAPMIGERWLFGPLNKSQLRMEVQLQPSKQGAVEALTALQAQATDPQEQARLASAIQHLTTSLEAGYWRGPSRLEPATGAQVFTREISAVVELQTIFQNSGSAIEPLDVINIIEYRILFVDRGLAEVAIADALAAGMDLVRLNPARAQIDQGDQASLNKNFAEAIGAYRDAWQLVSK